MYRACVCMYYPNKDFYKVTFYSTRRPCLNFAVYEVTCSLIHRIRCAPGTIWSHNNTFNTNNRFLRLQDATLHRKQKLEAYTWKAALLYVALYTQNILYFYLHGLNDLFIATHKSLHAVIVGQTPPHTTLYTFCISTSMGKIAHKALWYYYHSSDLVMIGE